MEKQFSDQLPTGPISIGNRDCEANKRNIDFGDLIIKVEESQKIKKQAKVERHCQTKKKPGIPAEYEFQVENCNKADA